MCIWDHPVKSGQAFRNRAMREIRDRAACGRTIILFYINTTINGKTEVQMVRRSLNFMDLFPQNLADGKIDKYIIKCFTGTDAFHDLVGRFSKHIRPCIEH
jgi:hypothetical protein